MKNKVELKSWFEDDKLYVGEYVKHKINQLDEPEVLSQEFINEHAEHHEYIGYAGVPVDDLQNLLVPKQEKVNVYVGEKKKVKVPKFVADWISEIKPDNSLRVAFEYIARRKIDNYDDELAFWVEEGNSETFARAWLDGYEIEQEQKYVVELPNPNSDKSRYTNTFLNKNKGKVFIDSANLFANDISKYTQFALTEQEIKDYDPRYWPFAVKVEELEE